MQVFLPNSFVRMTVIILACLLLILSFFGGPFNSNLVNAAEDCEQVAEAEFVCGPEHAEDLVKIPQSNWVIASSYDPSAVPNGTIYLVNGKTQEWEEVYPDAIEFKPNTEAYPSCPAPPDRAVFESHGLDIEAGIGNLHTLYVVNHGREAIEVFKVDANGKEPKFTWTGCVFPPEQTHLNDIAALPDGDGILATNTHNPEDTEFIDKLVDGQDTG